MNAAAVGGKWEPAAETLSALCEGSLDAISVSEHPICTQMLQRTFKDQEAQYLTTEQIGVAYFLVILFPISTTILRLCFCFG